MTESTQARSASDAAAQQKTRTYEYLVAGPDRDAASRLSGLEYMLALTRGDVGAKPPILDTMGLSEPFDLDYGQVTVESVPGDFLLNPLGVVHGGFAATMLDTVMGIAVHTTLAPGEGYTTAELKVNLTRAILPNGPKLRGEGKLIHRGRRMATAEGRIIGAEDGKLYAHGTTTCFIIPHEPRADRA